ncbi:MAG: hypothetical protein AABY87_13990 [bacterium]
MEKNESTTGVREPEENQDNSFWKRYGPNILLGVLIIYVILLGIGTYAELTHNDGILNWWIFK